MNSGYHEFMYKFMHELH